MKLELRRWMFGGAVGLFVLVVLLTQLAFEWRRAHETDGERPPPTAVHRTPTVPVVGDALGEAFAALEAMDASDPVRLQRVQQRLIDEARLGPERFVELFRLRLESIDQIPTYRALVLAEAFFASATDRQWGPVARFLESLETREPLPAAVALRLRVLERVRRAPPGKLARPALVPCLTRLVVRWSDLSGARSAAEAYLAMHRGEDEHLARERLRQLIAERPRSEHSAFSELLH